MVQWRKSSWSTGAQNSDCVEVAELGGRIGIRDSKAPGAGHITLTSEVLAELVGRVKRDAASI